MHQGIGRELSRGVQESGEYVFVSSCLYVCIVVPSILALCLEAGYFLWCVISGARAGKTAVASQTAALTKGAP